MNLYFSILALTVPAAAFVSQVGPLNKAFPSQHGLSLSSNSNFDISSRTSSSRTSSSSPSSSSSSSSSPSSTRSPISADSPPRPEINLSDKVKDLNTYSMVKVQGNSLKTWSFQSPLIDRVQVMIKTEGRPLNAEIDLWQGPDNIPQRMSVYIEDGSARPFNAVIETPNGYNTLGIRNTNTLEFPMSALVEAEVDGQLNLGCREDIENLAKNAIPRIVQGGAVYTKPFYSDVQSVQCLLRTDGRPMYARIELLQGPNNNKQVMDIYCEDGYTRPFYVIFETPGSGNVIRIVNTATMEYPLSATVEPYVIDDSIQEAGPTSFFIVD